MIYLYMLKQSLIKSDESIDYEKEWKKTILYRFFRVKNPSEGWKKQLRRLMSN